jgi:hypothetical protein
MSDILLEQRSDELRMSGGGAEAAGARLSSPMPLRPGEDATCCLMRINGAFSD